MTDISTLARLSEPTVDGSGGEPPVVEPEPTPQPPRDAPASLRRRRGRATRRPGVRGRRTRVHRVRVLALGTLARAQPGGTAAALPRRARVQLGRRRRRDPERRARRDRADPEHRGERSGRRGRAQRRAAQGPRPRLRHAAPGPARQRGGRRPPHALRRPVRPARLAPQGRPDLRDDRRRHVDVPRREDPPPRGRRRLVRAAHRRQPPHVVHERLRVDRERPARRVGAAHGEAVPAHGRPRRSRRRRTRPHRRARRGALHARVARAAGRRRAGGGLRRVALVARRASGSCSRRCSCCGLWYFFESAVRLLPATL